MRHVLTQALQRAALATGASRWLAGRQAARRVLMLHGVGGADMPLPEFEGMLRWLGRNFRVVALADVVDGLRRGVAPDPRGELALTFDDGLRNQYRLAYPVLRRLGLPATIFVCPDLVERRCWLWNHEVRARWQRLEPRQRLALAEEFGAAGSDVAAAVQRFKDLPPAAREASCRRLRQATPGFRATPEEQAAYDMMSWDDMRDMDPALVTIGSHTLTHPILPLLDDPALERELAQSRLRLEDRLQREVGLFCYPNGSTDSRVRAAAGRHYAAAVSTEESLATADADLLAIPRIPSTPNLALCAWRLHRPRA